MTTPPSSTVLAQVAALARLDLGELRDEWRKFFGTEPPGYGRDLMRRRLAYRIQELAYGGLSQEVRDRLRAIDEQARAAPKKPRDGIPIAGSVISKEWGGTRHDITVLADGFEYQGRPWRSLSQIARAITGTNWNGPAFFGLRPGAKRTETAR